MQHGATGGANKPPKPDILVEDDPTPEKFKNVPLGRFAHDGEQVVEDVDFTPVGGEEDSSNKEKMNEEEQDPLSLPEAVNDNKDESTMERPREPKKTPPSEAKPAEEMDTTLSGAFDNADAIIAFFEDKKELKHVKEEFESARERYLNANDEDEAEALLAYEQAQDDVQHAILEMLNAGAGYHNNIETNPALYTKGRVMEVFAKDFMLTKERRAQEAGERGPTGDREIDALLKNFKGEFGVLEEQFARARSAYLEATKKKREKIKGSEHAQNIRLSGKEARLRDTYLSARNDLLFALSNMTRAGAGYTRTSAEKNRDLRRKEISTDKVLETFIDHEQSKLGEDDDSTLRAYDRLERDILREIKRPNENSLMVFESRERKVQRASDKMARNEPLLAFGEVVGKRRATFAEGAKKRPIQKGLNSKPGFFSSLFSFVFGTPGRRRR